MPEFVTLIEMLEFRAKLTPERVAFTFLENECTYAELLAGIDAFAAVLQDKGIGPGDRVVLTLPNSKAFFIGFYAALRTGATAVPLFPGFGNEQVLRISRHCKARIILIPEDTPTALLDQFTMLARSDDILVLPVILPVTIQPATATPSAPGNIFPALQGHNTAFIQYTSGSTGDPKGVLISHNNLLTNIQQMISAMQITEDDIFVSWLPVYHDMGLILKTMVPFFLGIELHLLPTSLQDVRTWLRAIDKHRATFTAAPDFAWRLCNRTIKNPEDYDLTSLRLVLNAAEPVRSQTIQEFEQKFGLGHIMSPAYGLAEATVGVAMSPPNLPVRVDKHGHVSVGHAFPDIEIAIVDKGERAANNQLGEIAIKSTATPVGYLDNPEANKALFWQENYVLSGDLGYLDDAGDLYIVGRLKNTIILGGRTLYQQEIEESVGTHPNVRYCVALGIEHSDLAGEQVYLFAEVRDHATSTSGDDTSGDYMADDYEDMAIEIVARLSADLGFRPARVYLVRPKTIPLTYNGKFQHARLKQQFHDGSLFESGKVLYPAGDLTD